MNDDYDRRSQSCDVKKRIGNGGDDIAAHAWRLFRPEMLENVTRVALAYQEDRQLVGVATLGG